MKKKLLVLLIAVIPTLIPNMASAIAIDAGEMINWCGSDNDCVASVMVVDGCASS